MAKSENTAQERVREEGGGTVGLHGSGGCSSNARLQEPNVVEVAVVHAPRT